MANRITDSPYIIDTAGATVLATEFMRLWRVKWVGAVTAGDTAVIQDANGIVKWASHAPMAHYTEIDYPDEPIVGLVVPTLASGVLYITVR